MSSKTFRYGSLVVAILLLVGLFLGAFSTRGAAVTPPAQLTTVNRTGSGGNISTKSAPAWTAATRPWTKEEMLAAKPYPRPQADNTGAIDISPAGPTGNPGFVASSLPTDARVQTAEAGEPDIFSASAPLGYTYPAPFTRYKNLYSYLLFPNVTVGKLFFTQYGLNYVCSAASIGGYAIWTAGHCVHAGDGAPGGWSYNVVFVPAYQNGSAPKGQWYGYTLWTTGAWYNNYDLRYDYGGAVLDANGSGKSISQVVGNLGFAYNQVRNLHWFLMGYPAESPFSGLYQIVCTASYAYNYTAFGTPYPSGVGCDMTGGSSGGPWIYKFSGSAGSTNYLNGENSFGRVGYPKEMFTPYFDADTYDLWTTLVNDLP